MSNDNAPQVMSASEYWEVIKRRKGKFLVPFVIVLAAAAALAIMLPPTFRSEATLLVERQEIPTNIISTTIQGFVQERIESITQRVLTRENLLLIAEKAKLSAGEDAVSTDAMVKSLKESINVEMVDIDASDPSKGRQTSVTVAFVVSADAKTAVQANNITEQLTKLFMDANKEIRVQQATEVKRFLTAQSDELSARMQANEERLAVFKREKIGLLPGSADLNQAMLDRSETRIDAAENAVRNLQNQRRGMEAELRTVDKYVSRNADPEKANSALERLAIARQALGEAKQKYSDLHPNVRRLKSQIAQLETEVRSQNSNPAVVNGATNPEYIRLRSQLAAVNTDLAAEKSKLEELEAKASEYRSRLLAAPLVEKEYTSIVRDLEVDKQSFAALQAKVREAEIASNLEANDKGEKFSLLEPASMPSLPESPNRVAIFAMGIFFAGLIALGFVLIAEVSDKTVRGARALARLVDAPPIGVIPRHDSALANTNVK